MNNEEKEA